MSAQLIGSLVPGTGITYWFYLRETMAAKGAAVQVAQREAAEHRLKLLESQLEPHMLFNTLPNLRGLIGVDPDVRAARDGSTLVFTVREAGLGLSMAAADTTRFGLPKVGERQPTLYGNAATLWLAHAVDPGGCRSPCAGTRTNSSRAASTLTRSRHCDAPRRPDYMRCSWPFSSLTRSPGRRSSMR